ncbi:MAG: hypothetical protein WCZ66_09655 [Sphingomonadaceae bacterium]
MREVVGIFHEPKDLEGAVDELLRSGFDRVDINVLAAASTVEEKLGHKYDRVEQLTDDPDAPRTEYVSKASVGDAQGSLIGGLTYIGGTIAAGAVVATGGALAAAIAAGVLAGGGGGLIGAWLAKKLGERRAEYVEAQLDRGGLVLWVRTATPEKEARAVEILKKLCAGEVHAHGSFEPPADAHAEINAQARSAGTA